MQRVHIINFVAWNWHEHVLWVMDHVHVRYHQNDFPLLMIFRKWIGCLVPYKVHVSNIFRVCVLIKLNLFSFRVACFVRSSQKLHIDWRIKDLSRKFFLLVIMLLRGFAKYVTCCVQRIYGPKQRQKQMLVSHTVNASPERKIFRENCLVH